MKSCISKAGKNKVKAITNGKSPNQHKLIKSEYLYLANNALAPTNKEAIKQVFKPNTNAPLEINKKVVELCKSLIFSVIPATFKFLKNKEALSTSSTPISGVPVIKDIKLILNCFSSIIK